MPARRPDPNTRILDPTGCGSLSCCAVRPDIHARARDGFLLQHMAIRCNPNSAQNKAKSAQARRSIAKKASGLLDLQPKELAPLPGMNPFLFLFVGRWGWGLHPCS
jgi:hypothetical protein